MNDYGVVLDPTTLRFTRRLPASVQEVWAWLTDSDKRGRWLASGDMELTEGGGRDAAVSACRPVFRARTDARGLQTL